MWRISCSPIGFICCFRCCARVLCVGGAHSSTCQSIYPSIYYATELLKLLSFISSSLHSPSLSSLPPFSLSPLPHIPSFLTSLPPSLPPLPSVSILHFYHQHTVLLKVVIVTDDVGVVKHCKDLNLYITIRNGHKKAVREESLREQGLKLLLSLSNLTSCPWVVISK